ncbi:hypothetical protein HIM_09109 [Hirsutella minnesotensis 3608]|uniref:Uncharacterized protein n=1 Tax=Hirsutella minnesotensis 3608 TaxID=1043627 RepID=A0A0F7ZLU3_9HYPO|nr:hypothetical protein HIM_09109 [Hirsutella minnesotensis 3608]
MTLRKTLSRVPVTALSFYQAPSGRVLVLAGEDARVLAYAAEETCDGAAIWDMDVLGDQPVHGMRVWQRAEQARVLVWGSSSVAVVDIGRPEDGTAPRVLARGTAPDWIYDGAISPWDGDAAAVVTAHNEIVPLTFSGGRDGRLGQVTFGAATSPSRPMLYSARLAWLTAGCVLVAAGTVFGDVVVWKCSLAGGAAAGGARDHGSTMRLLATCSDDRTIRIWDITDRQAEERTPSTEHSGFEATGFKPASGAEDSATDSGRLVAVAMGHASRIWGVKIGLGDAAALRDGDAVCVYWAGAVLCQPRRTLIATGGGDSRVCLVQEPAVDGSDDEQGACPDRLHDGLVTVEVQDILDSLSSPGAPLAGKELISRYDFLSDEEMLVSTSLGRLFVGSLAAAACWEEVRVEKDVADDLRLTYALRAVSQGAAVIGTTAGHLFYYNASRRVTRIAQLPGKVHDLETIADPDQDGEASAAPSVQVMVYLHGNPESHYLTLDRASGRLVCHQRTGGLDARFTPVSAARLGDVLLVGSRRGWLSILTRQADVWWPQMDLPPRSNDAISAIVPLPSRDSSGSPSPYFLATSRDGKFRIYCLETANDVFQCRLVHETSPPFGPMIEGAWFTRDAVPELILYGFRSKDFVVWNETRREELATVDCGGAHRTFRLWHRASDPLRCRLAFTRTSKLSVYSQARLAFRTLKPGTHGREIKALCSNKRYVATGAEDTSIQIWKVTSEQGSNQVQSRHMASIKAHVSGIQRLRWLGDEYLFSSGGNEEFFVWRVRELESAYKGLAVVCEAVFEDRTDIGDLRIMDFDVDEDPDSDRILVTLALSNSTLRTFWYRREAGFEPVAQGLYTGACLTQVRHLGTCKGTPWVVTASTDGHMALWKMQQQGASERSYEMTETAQVHQNSIKGLDMVKKQTSYMFLTGGDDNALGVVLVGLAEDGSGYAFLKRGIVRSAHAAAINSVLLLGEEEDGDMYGVSVSNDQRVRLWRIRGMDSSKVELLGCACSGVADPGDAAQIWPESGGRHMVLGGVGVEAWRCDEAR